MMESGVVKVSDVIEAQNEDGIATAINGIGWNKPAEETVEMCFNNIENKLVMKHSEIITNMRIYSITGQILINEDVNYHQIQLYFNFLPRGIYVVSIRDIKNKVFSKKLVKF